MTWDVIRDHLDDVVYAIEAIKHEASSFGSLEKDVYSTIDGVVLTVTSFKELTYWLQKVEPK